MNNLVLNTKCPKTAYPIEMEFDIIRSYMTQSLISFHQYSYNYLEIFQIP